MPVLHDATVTGDNAGGATTVASAALTTSGGRRLLIASVSLTFSATSVTSISGAGLTWELVRKLGADPEVEAWRAWAQDVVTGEVITATLSTTSKAVITVSAYRGTNGTASQNGADAVGNVIATAGTSAAPSHILDTTGREVLVISCLSAENNPTITAGTDQTINGQDAATATLAGAQARQDNSTLEAGTLITNSYTLGSSQDWAMLGIELYDPTINLRQVITGGQSKTAGTTVSTNVATPTIAGNTIIVGFAMDDDGASPGAVSCADSTGNVYAVIVDRSKLGAGTGARCVIFAAFNARVVSSFIEVTHPNVTARAFQVLEVTGINCVDKTTSAIGASTTPASGSVTTSQANEFLCGLVAAEGPQESTWTQGTGWIKVPRRGTTAGGAASNMSACLEYRIVSATGSFNADGTITSADWAAAIATFCEAPHLPRRGSFGQDARLRR